jgi:phospholipase/lecithinase/hemolysin
MSTIALAVALAIVSRGASGEKPPNRFVFFGDSLVDCGNTHAILAPLYNIAGHGFWWTSGDGAPATSVVASILGLSNRSLRYACLPSLLRDLPSTPELFGADPRAIGYALGGATVVPAHALPPSFGLGPLADSPLIAVPSQVATWAASARSRPGEAERTVVFLEGGANDVFWWWEEHKLLPPSGTGASLAAFEARVVAQFESLLEELGDAGVRRVVVSTLPDFTRLPQHAAMRDHGVHEAIASINHDIAALAAAAARFDAVRVFDFDRGLATLIEHRREFGIEHVSVCAPPAITVDCCDSSVEDNCAGVALTGDTTGHPTGLGHLAIAASFLAPVMREMFQ